AGKWCSKCKNKTEGIMLKYLINIYPNIITQARFEWCRSEFYNKPLFFDFLLEEYKLIIELDGKQHFQQVANWESPEIIRERDYYKMDKAKENGYSIIRILQNDVWNNIYIIGKMN